MRENSTFTKDTKISVVDDDDSMREAIKALIGSMGLSVEDFSSAEDFLNSGRSQAFDCFDPGRHDAWVERTGASAEIEG